MNREYKNAIFTRHALERLKLRRITQDMVIRTLTKPDSTQKEADDDTEFIRVVDGRKVHVIAAYLKDEKKWLIKSVWVRGEDDPIPVWQRLMQAVLRLVGLESGKRSKRR